MRCSIQSKLCVKLREKNPIIFSFLRTGTWGLEASHVGRCPHIERGGSVVLVFGGTRKNAIASSSIECFKSEI